MVEAINEALNTKKLGFMTNNTIIDVLYTDENTGTFFLNSHKFVNINEAVNSDEVRPGFYYNEETGDFTSPELTLNG